MKEFLISFFLFFALTYAIGTTEAKDLREPRGFTLVKSLGR